MESTVIVPDKTMLGDKILEELTKLSLKQVKWSSDKKTLGFSLFDG